MAGEDRALAVVDCHRRLARIEIRPERQHGEAVEFGAHSGGGDFGWLGVEGDEGEQESEDQEASCPSRPHPLTPFSTSGEGERS